MQAALGTLHLLHDEHLQGDRWTRRVRQRFSGMHHSQLPHVPPPAPFVPLQRSGAWAVSKQLLVLSLEQGWGSAAQQEGQDPTSHRTPCPPSQTAPSHQLALRVPQVTAWLIKPQRVVKVPHALIWSNFCLSNTFQAHSCHYSESNETKRN